MATTSARSIAEASTLTVAGGTKVYSTIEELPFAGNQVGDQAFVTTGNKLYIWTGTQWFNIAIVNEAPVISQGSSATYAVVVGEPDFVINIVASDPEGLPLTYSYTVSTGTLGNTAVTANANVFTVSSTNNVAADNGATFSLTFNVSDGYNTTTNTSDFTVIYPPDPTGYGWFGGGDNPAPWYISTVDRIDYTADTSTASVRGPLSVDRQYPAATGNDSYGWWGGGNGAPGYLSSVDRVDYTADTGTASVRGPLTVARRQWQATGNTNYGWFAGAYGNTTVNRITYSSDGSTASVRGQMTNSATYMLGAAGNTNYGWFHATGSMINRIDYADDLVTASIRGPLLYTYNRESATGNADYGYFIHGVTTSRVQRIEYAADTATAIERAPMLVSTHSSAATGTVDYAWVGGGSIISTVNRIFYANDVSSPKSRGPLSSARRYLSAAGGYPG